MNDDENEMTDEQFLTRVGDALGYDPDRQPSPDRVSAIRAAAAQQGPADTDSVVRAAPAHRRRPDSDNVVQMPTRRRMLMGGIAASVVGAAIGFGGRSVLDDDEKAGPDGPPTEAIAFGGAAGGVDSDARLINHTWGTELMLDVSGLASGQVYRVVYRGSDGRAVQAGSFLGVDGVLMRCRFNAGVLRAGLASIDVLDASGQKVLRADLA